MSGDLEAENARIRNEAKADRKQAFNSMRYGISAEQRCERAEAECSRLETALHNAEVENRRLRIALHDAIRRPLGVTPDSAAEFYDQRMADEAEVRRPRWFDRAPPAPPGILIAADQSRPPSPPGKTRVAKARRPRPTTPTNTDTGEGE